MDMSLTNCMYSGKNTPPIVGEGVTQLMYSDRQAYEVTYVSDDMKTIKIKPYVNKRSDNNGISESQDYIYDELHDYEYTVKFLWGSWRIVGEVYEPIKKKCTYEEYAQCVDDDGFVKDIPGVTKLRKTYEKINLVFGMKRTYRDPCF